MTPFVQQTNQTGSGFVVLRFSSCQAENAESFCRAVATFIGEKLRIPTEFVGDIPWQERERMLDLGEIQVCWICGLLYARKHDRGRTEIELLAAPVMRHPRYGGKPVYYSDITVHRDSRFQSFADLRQARWAYNEIGSHSGYNLLRYHLALKGMGSEYFGSFIESGSHQNSLGMILGGLIDAAAVDSTVLETEIGQNPLMAARIRIVTTLGPSPEPPWVVHRSVSKTVRRDLRRLFLSMHRDMHGRRILGEAGILRFAAVSDSDYNPIREMDWIAGVQW
jgi:phosphonate transport system substrate-binding protein